MTLILNPNLLSQSHRLPPQNQTRTLRKYQRCCPPLNLYLPLTPKNPPVQGPLAPGLPVRDLLAQVLPVQDLPALVLSVSDSPAQAAPLSLIRRLIQFPRQNPYSLSMPRCLWMPRCLHMQRCLFRHHKQNPNLGPYTIHFHSSVPSWVPQAQKSLLSAALQNSPSSPLRKRPVHPTLPLHSDQALRHILHSHPGTFPCPQWQFLPPQSLSWLLSFSFQPTFLLFGITFSLFS